MAPFHKQCIARGCDAEPHYGMKRGEETRWACGKHKGMIGFTSRPAEAPPHPVAAARRPPSPTRGEGSDLFSHRAG